MSGNLTRVANGRPEMFMPGELGSAIAESVHNTSLALSLTTKTTISAERTFIPVIDEDPTASWLREGQEIDDVGARFHELEVVPQKVGGVTSFTNELANVEGFNLTELVVDPLVRDIARQIDKAFFSSVPAPAPKGLADVAAPTDVTLPKPVKNLDPFAEAITNAEAKGRPITAFVANAETIMALAKLKDSDTSNRPLIGTADASAASHGEINGRIASRHIFGVPLFAAEAVQPDTVWGIVQSAVHSIVRQDVKVDTSDDVYFTSDRLAVRATMRVAFGVALESAVYKISASGSGE